MYSSWSLGGQSVAEIRGTNKSAETCGAPHRVVGEAWDTLYSLLLRSVGHRIECLVRRGALCIACY